MKDHVLVEYYFMFSPQDIWGHMNEFEKDLAEFFETKGLDATSIPLLNQPNKRYIIVKTKPADTRVEPPVRLERNDVRINRNG